METRFGNWIFRNLLAEESPRRHCDGQSLVGEDRKGIGRFDVDVKPIKQLSGGISQTAYARKLVFALGYFLGKSLCGNGLRRKLMCQFMHDMHWRGHRSRALDRFSID